MNKIDIYKKILRDTIKEDTPNDDVLMHMVVLHTHSILLRAGVAVNDVRTESGDQRILLGPLTRTHLAELVSSLWSKKTKRGEQAFWFASYGELTPYELFSNVPYEERDKAAAAKINIMRHDFVEDLIEE